MSRAHTEHGFALVKALIVVAAVVTMATATLVVSRTDTIVSGNVERGTKGLWTAIAGAERGKAWLGAEATPGTLNYLNPAMFSATPVPQISESNFADGYSHTVTIETYPAGQTVPIPTPNEPKYRITSVTTGPDNTRQTVEEIVRIAGRTFDLGVIDIDGNTAFPKVGQGTSLPIPAYTVDGRDFDRFGKLAGAAGCAEFPPVRGVAGSTSQNQINTRITNLKCAVVREANTSCNATGGGGGCTPGLYWVRGSGTDPRFDHNANALDFSDCTSAPPLPDPPLGPNECCLALDLDAPELRATSVTDNTVNPPAVVIPAPPHDRGPFRLHAINTASLQPSGLYEVITLADVQKSVADILDAIIDLPVSKRTCLTSDLNGGGNVTYGSWDEPHVVFIPPNGNPSNPRVTVLKDSAPCSGSNGQSFLDVTNGTNVTGTGILVVGTAMRIRDANFHWRGIVVITGDGDLRVEDTGAPGNTANDPCGAIYGAVVLQDSTGGDFKVDFESIIGINRTCSNPYWDGVDTPTQNTINFSINHSCEAIDRALSFDVSTIAWTEKFQ